MKATRMHEFVHLHKFMVAFGTVVQSKDELRIE
jgi:hypothetical protein